MSATRRVLQVTGVFVGVAVLVVLASVVGFAAGVAGAELIGGGL